MPSWQRKTRGTRLGYRIFVWVLKTMGVLPAYFLLRFVTFYYLLFPGKAGGPLFDYFHRRLGYGRLVSFGKMYKNFYLFGQTLIDKVVLMTGIPNRFSFDFDGEDQLRAMVDLQRGGLLLSAHIGNWEIAGQLLKRLGTKIRIVMYDGEQQQIKEYLASVTGERTAQLILIKNDLSHIYAIHEALRNHELVCIHADRFTENTKTLDTVFLGAPARFPAGPFVLAARCGVPVSFVFAMKESRLHYHFFASAIKEYKGLDKETGIQYILTDFAKEMEEKVKKYPEQWYNYYDFWQSGSTP
ncbi:MAG TPA: hypothetical protein VMI35_09070 [Puia sp.]|nr:hypothetical protein [Puia sp.]